MRLNYAVYVAVNDIRVFLADRANYVNLFIMPIILAFVLGFAFRGGDSAQNIRVDIIDNDNSPQSQALLDALRVVNPTFVLCPMDDARIPDFSCDLDEPFELSLGFSVEQSLERLDNRVSASLIVIPANYGHDLSAFNDVQIDYYSYADRTTGDGVLTSLQAAIQRENGAVVAARVGQGIGDVLLEEDNTDEFADRVYHNALRQWANDESLVRFVTTQASDQAETTGSGFNQSVPGMACMYVLFTAMAGLQTLLEERKHWTLQRLVILPISRATILSGKILGRVLMGMITFSVMFIVGLGLGVDFGGNLAAAFLIMLAYSICTASMTFAMAPLIRSEGQAASLSVMISIVFSALGGAWWPLEIVPEPMRVIGHLSPVAWAMNGFNELIYFGGEIVDILLPVAVLLLASMVLFVIGITTFKYE